MGVTSDIVAEIFIQLEYTYIINILKDHHIVDYFRFSLWEYASCCVYNLIHYKYKPMQLLLLHTLSFRFFWGNVVVKALCYKHEGRGFYTQWGNFF
jgi:hypothetical protein